MKIVLVNFYDPVKKRLILWFIEMNIKDIISCNEDMESTERSIKTHHADLLFLDTEHTAILVSTIKRLHRTFPGLTLIGLTNHYSQFVHRKLRDAGLADYMEINDLLEKGADYIFSKGKMS